MSRQDSTTESSFPSIQPFVNAQQFLAGAGRDFTVGDEQSNLRVEGIAGRAVVEHFDSLDEAIEPHSKRWIRHLVELSELLQGARRHDEPLDELLILFLEVREPCGCFRSRHAVHSTASIKRKST